MKDAEMIYASQAKEPTVKAKSAMHTMFKVMAAEVILKAAKEGKSSCLLAVPNDSCLDILHFYGFIVEKSTDQRDGNLCTIRW